MPIQLPFAFLIPLTPFPTAFHPSFFSSPSFPSSSLLRFVLSTPFFLTLPKPSPFPFFPVLVPTLFLSSPSAIFKVLTEIFFIFPMLIDVFFITTSSIFICLASSGVEFPFAAGCWVFLLPPLTFSPVPIFQQFSPFSFAPTFLPSLSSFLTLFHPAFSTPPLFSSSGSFPFLVLLCRFLR